MTTNVICILGATGRIGRTVAARLAADGHSLLLVGRDTARLTRIAEPLGECASIEVAATIPAILEMIARLRPAIVLNTIGPFSQTAVPVARACPPGTHYIDLSNELPSVLELLALHEHAASSGSVYVTGAGFGVLATESVVLRLCADQPPAKSVRCAAIPGVAVEPGPLGEAFAASITEGLASGGRRYEGGVLSRVPLLSDFERVPLPDGRLIATASGPSGELEAARRASGATFAVATTSMVPSSPILRATLPALLAVMRISAVRRFAARRIAAIEVKPAVVTTPQVSWAHARVEWSSGVTKQGWMRTGDAMVFTAEVATKLVARLAGRASRPGAYTPGSLFGFELATECGGEIMIEAAEV